MHKDAGGAAGLDEDVDLHLGFVAEEAVLVLAGHGADAAFGDEAEEVRMPARSSIFFVPLTPASASMRMMCVRGPAVRLQVGA